MERKRAGTGLAARNLALALCAGTEIGRKQSRPLGRWPFPSFPGEPVFFLYLTSLLSILQPKTSKVNGLWSWLCKIGSERK